MTTKAFANLVAKNASTPFRNWIERGSSAKFPAEKHRYHLYVSLACPWASRCLAAMYLKGLDGIVGLSVVHPVFQRTRPDDPEDSHIGWTFVDPAVTPTLPGPTGLGAYPSTGAIPDTINNAKFVRDLYEIASPSSERFSVPVLWDKQQRTIVSNESEDIVRMLNSAFDELVPSSIDLYPVELRAEINAVNEWVFPTINRGVYRCGFADSQQAYDEAVAALFASLDRAEEILGNHRYLVGDRFTEADLRLFVTLVRFDEVYAVHFKANKKLIQQYPNLSNYTREIYQLPAVKRSVAMDHIKLHYYASHTHLNALGIVPAGPSVDFDLPHDRSRFRNASPPRV